LDSAAAIIQQNADKRISKTFMFSEPLRLKTHSPQRRKERKKKFESRLDSAAVIIQ
jgi:hypothetical protein